MTIGRSSSRYFSIAALFICLSASVASTNSAQPLPFGQNPSSPPSDSRPTKSESVTPKSVPTALDKETAARAPQPTVIMLVQNVNNSVQLSIHISGEFSYPFVFSMSPSPTNGISISSSGRISGTPAQNTDQNITITVDDSDGKTIDTYPIVLHVVEATTVVLGNAASSPSLAAVQKSQSQGQIVIDPIYAGGDTVTGSAMTSPTGSGEPTRLGKRARSDHRA